jgi:hypothetical protein
MTESKKPPQSPKLPLSPSKPSGEFEFHRPSLGPGPGIRLPPSQVSVPSMAPIKLPLEPAGSTPAEPPIGVPAESLSVLPTAMKAPQIFASGAPDAPVQESLPPPPRSLPPLSLRPAPPVGRRRIWLALLGASLVAAALVLVRSRYGETQHVALPAPPHLGVFPATFDVRTFQRGNIHTHTTRSDGHQSPREVATWYREHGYQFLAITDHDVLVDPADVADVEGPGFVLIPGEEISSTAIEKPVHIQAVCIDHLIASGHFETPLAALTAALAAVRAQNGFGVVNHPNFGWAFGVADLAPLPGSYALEIWSGHPSVHSAGDATRPSHEAIWDELLTRGRRVTAVAVDDVHTLVPTDGGADALPGQAWIQTFGLLGREPVCDALRNGRLYASSGVAFRRIRIEPGRFTVWVDDPNDTVAFIASASQILATVTGDAFVHDDDGFAASYVLRGGEAYVRVQARAPDGGAAWTQAYATSP